MIGLTGAIVLVSVSGKTNSAARVVDLLAPTAAGLLLGALMLGAMSAVRYAVFGPGPMELSF